MYLVEEVLELDHAIATGDEGRLRTELGDVLLHVAFQIVLAEERGDFGAEDLTRAVETKMWRRHPHLYAEATGDEVPPHVAHTLSKGEVADQWERIKGAERRSDESVLDGLPPALPALIEAFRLQERAAGVGFDWPDADGPIEKVVEECGEVRSAHAAGDSSRTADEVGDLLFSVVNVARKLGIDPRAALERANAKFRDRFRRLEHAARARGIDVARTDMATLDGLWEEVKTSAQG